MNPQFKKLFEPITINGMELTNRIALAPMGMGYASAEDFMTDKLITYYARRAEGGTGLIITGVAPVALGGRPQGGLNSIYDDKFIPGWKELADAIHKAGSKLAIQLIHGGIEGFPFFTKQQQVSPSGGVWGLVEYLFEGADFSLTGFPTRALTVEEIKDIETKFAEAARRAKEVGADAIELNGAQGFLIQQFMSPLFNKRTDEYGGSLENRMRFPLEVIARGREVVGKDFPIIFRMVATEGVEEGITLEDAKTMAQMIEKAGVDALHITAGRGITLDAVPLMMPIAETGQIPIIDQIGEVKKVINVPVIGVQRIVSPELAERILEDGKADMVALGRPLIADPDWPKKAYEGRPEDIRKCIGCLQGCLDTLLRSYFSTCLQNPEVGIEKEYEIKRVKEPKKILVIGGGPAGLETALVAGLRGHNVTLCEKEGEFGGQWNLASIPPGKEDFRYVVEWRVNQLKKLDNVKLELNKEVLPEMVRELKPDIAVVATGSVPVIPRIPGVDGDNVVTAHDVLSGKAKVGDTVAVIGGGATGCETAHFLGHQGKKVTVIEMLKEIARDEELVRGVWLKKSFEKEGVEVRTSAPVKKITDAGEIIATVDGKDENLGSFDTIVLAVGVKSVNKIAEQIEDIVPAVYEVGDAYARPTTGYGAIQHGALIGREI